MVTTLALCFALSQVANPYAGMSFSNPLSGSLDPALFRRLWAHVTHEPLDKPAPKLGLDATDFKPPQPRSVAQAMVSASKGVGREQGKALVEGLNAGLDAFERESRKNNVACALAFLIAVSRQALGEKELSDAELQQLAQALNDELGAAPSYRKMTARQKQVLYETSIVAGSLIGGMAAGGEEANDAELKQQAKQLAQSALSPFTRK